MICENEVLCFYLKFTVVFEVSSGLPELRTVSCVLVVKHRMLKGILHASTLSREQRDCLCLKPCALLLLCSKTPQIFLPLKVPAWKRVSHCLNTTTEPGVQ